MLATILNCSNRTIQSKVKQNQNFSKDLFPLFGKYKRNQLTLSGV